MNKRKLIVVCALIIKDGKCLIAKRSTGDVNMLGKWEFPGGKVEPNEEEKHAIEREIYEEFNLYIEATKYITETTSEYKDRIINLKMYECNYISGEFDLHDHSEIKWVNSNELLNYDLAPADIDLAKYLQK